MRRPKAGRNLRESLDIDGAPRHKRDMFFDCGPPDGGSRKDGYTMKLLLQIFTWWNNQTIGTRFHTWRFGTKVGEDELGNVYYQGGKDSEGRTRRWVIYSGYADASAIPPGWHGWMHHRTDVSPVDEQYQAREWQKQHRPNQTGTAQAYRPPGSIAAAGERPRVTGDYDAWTPRS